MLKTSRILVEAGAGCGKTTSIVQKFKNSCASTKQGGLGITPQDILLLTFTDAAAKEMRARIEKQCPELDLSNGFIGTFHSFCLKILRQSPDSKLSEETKIFSEKEIGILFKNQFLDQLSQVEKLSDILSSLSLSSVLDLTLKGNSPHKEIEEDFKKLQETWENFKKKLCLSLNSLDLEDFSESDWPHQSLKLLEEKDIDAKIAFSQKKNLKNLAQNNPLLVESVKKIREILSKNNLTPLLEEWEKEKKILTFLHEELQKVRKKLPRFLSFSEVEKLTIQALEDKSLKIPFFKLIIVDEFQDTSPEQWKIIQNLSQQESQWYLVGDPKQSIYGFRKADIRLYTQLREKLEVQSLEKNYRSSAEILDFVNLIQDRIFSEKSDPEPQTLVPGKEISSLTSPILIHECESIDHDLLLKTIFKRQSSQKNAGESNLKHAVLFREWKKLYDFSEFLTQKRIAFKIEGADNYLDHFLTDQFCEFLNGVFQEESKRSDVLSSFQFLLSQDKIKFYKESKDYICAFYDFSFQIQPDRWPQGSEWVSSMERFLFEKIQKGFFNWQDILQMLYKKEYDSFELNIPLKKDANELEISLMTIHGSKGLEFDCVYLPDPRESSTSRNSFEDDEIPFTYQVTPQRKSRSLLFELQKAERLARLEAEQKRLFYVALTRAKKSLDLYFLKEKTSAANSTSNSFSKKEVAWYQIWNESLNIDRFKWRQALLSLKNSNSVKWVEHSDGTATKEKIFLSPLQTKRASKLFSIPKEKISESEKQKWGTKVHRCLEYWNGDESNLSMIVAKLEASEQKDALSTLKELKTHKDLDVYWKALSDQNAEWMVFREEQLIETFSENSLSQNRFLRADALLLRREEAIVIDWKTSQDEQAFTPERLQNIEEQLKRYGESLKGHIPKVTLLAIGIFRNPKLSSGKKVKTLFKKDI
jgi:ATP-dependent exoDNAse (exonuclease V) beta subunit